MKKTSLLFAVFICLASFSQAQTKEQVLKKVWSAVGGKNVFEKSRYLKFTFAVEKNGKNGTSRSHLWDRYTGNYRFENKTKKGEKLVVLFNVNSKKGKAYLNGIEVADQTKEEAMVKNAYATFINDSYWLMVPLKLHDPGVNTELAGREDINGQECEIIHLNFDKVGLTPGDQYWLYVNNKTGEIVQWKLLLQGQKNSAVFTWQPYQDLGNGLKLSVKKTNTASQTSIYFPIAKVLKNVNKDTFIKP